MMNGNVNTELEPLLQLTIRDSTGQTQDVEAVIDTGFNGFVTLPQSLIAALQLSWLCRQQGELADGSFSTFDVFAATAEWHGKAKMVEVEAADAQPLIGMALLEGPELRIEVKLHGDVAAEELP
jgi:clan AA aspartic protease